MATSAAAGTHLAAAATILNGSCKRLLLKTNEQQRRDENLVLSLEAVIFHAATPAPFQETAEHPAIVDDAFATAQAVLEQLRDRGEYSVETSPILGAPPKLFHFVRQFSLLRRKRGTTDLDDINQMQDLGRQFELWRLDEYNSSPIRDDAGHDEIQETIGPDLYVFVLRLLFSCMDTIRPLSNGEEETLLRKTMSLTGRIDPVTGYFADYYCWPFYWLGTCLQGRDDAQRLLLKKVSAFYDVTRIDAMRKLGIVLQDIWAG